MKKSHELWSESRTAKKKAMKRRLQVAAWRAWIGCGLLLSCAASDSRAQDAMPVRVCVDAGHPVRTISKFLTGSHFVYAFESDALYSDERIADWMRRSKVGVIRWPGGTAVQNYHWDHLNGIAFKEDSWDPDYKATDVASGNYMDLDEYIAFCRRVGAEPMVGINIKSGKKYKREAEALDEARRLITYCRDKNYGVKFWYIGNECFKGFGARGYARYIDRYGEVLRSVDSNIVVIGDWKFGPEEKRRFEECVEIAATSRQLDVMEIHEKWGNDWSLTTGHTKADWRAECPLYNGKLGDYIRKFHQAMKDAGRPQVKLAFNEWGIGNVSDGDEFDYALVAADFLVEIFRNDVEQACYWNLNMGPGKSRVLATTENRSRLLKFNPVAHVFEMYAHALGGELLEVATSEKCVYGFAVRGPGDELQVYLLNKNEQPAAVELSIEPGELEGMRVRTEALVAPGELVSSDHGIQAVGQSCVVELKPSSFTTIVIAKDD